MGRSNSRSDTPHTCTCTGAQRGADTKWVARTRAIDARSQPEMSRSNSRSDTPHTCTCTGAQRGANPKWVARTRGTDSRSRPEMGRSNSRSDTLPAQSDARCRPFRSAPSRRAIRCPGLVGINEGHVASNQTYRREFTPSDGIRMGRQTGVNSRRREKRRSADMQEQKEK